MSIETEISSLTTAIRNLTDVLLASAAKALPTATATATPTVTVATAEPFVRAWADDLEEMIKREVKFVFANPVEIKRYISEFFNLARSMKRR